MKQQKNTTEKHLMTTQKHHPTHEIEAPKTRNTMKSPPPTTTTAMTKTAIEDTPFRKKSQKSIHRLTPFYDQKIP